MTKEELDEELREQIAKGEITADDAESEMDYFANGDQTFENTYGYGI